MLLPPGWIYNSCEHNLCSFWCLGEILEVEPVLFHIFRRFLKFHATAQARSRTALRPGFSSNTPWSSLAADGAQPHKKRMVWRETSRIEWGEWAREPRYEANTSQVAVGILRSIKRYQKVVDYPRRYHRFLVQYGQLTNSIKSRANSHRVDRSLVRNTRAISLVWYQFRSFVVNKCGKCGLHLYSSTDQREKDVDILAILVGLDMNRVHQLWLSYII